MTYIFGDLGKCWPIFRDLGSKGKILLGGRGNYFQGSGEINALFSGIKGAQTPLGGLTGIICIFLSNLNRSMDPDRHLSSTVKFTSQQKNDVL